MGMVDALAMSLPTLAAPSSARTRSWPNIRTSVPLLRRRTWPATC